MAIGLGLKKKVVKPLGKKLKKAEKVGMKTGKALDVGGRKVANTARKAENVLGVAERNLTGVPVVGDLATAGRQLSRQVNQGAQKARKGGQALERGKRERIIKKHQAKSSNNLPMKLNKFSN
jgi:hypothetical protein